MLAHLSDQDLVLRLKAKVKAERALLVELLRYLEEVERRKLFLARGYSSLFAFCVEELGYSDGEAHSRIQAMRLGKAVPEVKAKLSAGDISLTVAAKAQSCFMRSAKADRPVTRQDKLSILNNLTHIPTREAEKILAAQFPEAAMPREMIKPIAEEMTRVEFNLNSSQLAKLEKLKGLLAHGNYEGRLDRLFETIADIALAKLDKSTLRATESAGREKGDRTTGAANRNCTNTEVTLSDAPLLEAPQVKLRQVDRQPAERRLEKRSSFDDVSISKKPSRYVSVHVRRQVWARDQGKCQYQDSMTGRRCDSRHALELDHVRPFAQGGGNTSANLRLFCAAHNKWRAL